MSLDTTLCITAGGRPDLLNETLASLLPHNGQFFDHILITNDRGDEAPNEVVRNWRPPPPCSITRRRSVNIRRLMRCTSAS